MLKQTFQLEKRGRSGWYVRNSLRRRSVRVQFGVTLQVDRLECISAVKANVEQRPFQGRVTTGAKAQIENRLTRR